MGAKIEDGLTRNQRYYRSHKEVQAARGKAWRLANPDRAHELTREYYARNSARILAQKRGTPRPKTDAIREYDRNNKAQRRAATPIADAMTVEEWLAICDRFGGRCAYCGEVAPLAQDHVIPVSRGGLHVAANIVPACKPCNSSKNFRAAPVHRKTVPIQIALGTYTHIDHSPLAALVRVAVFAILSKGLSSTSTDPQPSHSRHITSPSWASSSPIASTLVMPDRATRADAIHHFEATPALRRPALAASARS